MSWFDRRNVTIVIAFRRIVEIVEIPLKMTKAIIWLIKCPFEGKLMMKSFPVESEVGHVPKCPTFFEEKFAILMFPFNDLCSSEWNPYRFLSTNVNLTFPTKSGSMPSPCPYMQKSSCLYHATQQLY